MIRANPNEGVTLEKPREVADIGTVEEEMRAAVTLTEERNVIDGYLAESRKIAIDHANELADQEGLVDEEGREAFVNKIVADMEAEEGTLLNFLVQEKAKNAAAIEEQTPHEPSLEDTEQKKVLEARAKRLREDFQTYPSKETGDELQRVEEELNALS